MKIFLIVLPFAFLFFTSCNTSKIAYKHYGPAAVDTTQAVSLDEMLAIYNADPQKEFFTFSAPLVGVCQSAGCWVNVQPSNGDIIRVRFKDHFLIPPTTALKSISYFSGHVYYDTLSVELQKHFLADAKASPSEIDQITAPKIELNFEADGVLVKKSAKN